MDGMNNNSIDFPKFYHFTLVLFRISVFSIQDHCQGTYYRSY